MTTSETSVTIRIDGEEVEVESGATLLDACKLV